VYEKLLSPHQQKRTLRIEFKKTLDSVSIILQFCSTDLPDLVTFPPKLSNHTSLSREKHNHEHKNENETKHDLTYAALLPLHYGLSEGGDKGLTKVHRHK
jgi:hypothetical protein